MRRGLVLYKRQDLPYPAISDRDAEMHSVCLFSYMLVCPRSSFVRLPFQPGCVPQYTKLQRGAGPPCVGTPKQHCDPARHAQGHVGFSTLPGLDIALHIAPQHTSAPCGSRTIR